MKTSQDNSDKILRDKINSLDSLPEDYAPSLDSKWELLMAGIQPAEPKIVAIEEKKEKKRYFYLYASAACFLAIFTFGWLFLRDDKSAGNQVAVVTEQPTKISAAMPEKVVAPAQENPTENTEPKTKSAREISEPAKAKNPAVTRKKQQTFIASAKPKNQQQTVKSSTEVSPEKTTQPEQLTSAQPEQLLATSASSKPAKTKTANKKKAKSVELDFEAEKTIALPAQHDPQVAQQNLKFKFMPKAGVSGNVASENSPLKVKHTF